MNKWLLILAALVLAGCASQPPEAILSEAPEPDPATAEPSYWWTQPPAATVYCDDYDRLWNACDQTARLELFTPDRQDYRDGLLSTRPLVSKQIFEFWRPDTGDTYGVMQNSLQTVRRTIQFQFTKTASGYTVVPKVLIERFSRPNRRITATAEFHAVFTKPEESDTEDYWFATGRDVAMEAELAARINKQLNPPLPG